MIQILPPRNNRIFWFLVGNPEFVASSRIQGLRIHEKLKELGYHSVLPYTPAGIEEEIPYKISDKKRLKKIFREGDIIALQKIKNEINIPLFHELRRCGVKMVLIDCDLPLSPEISKMTDLVICCSKRLSELYSAEGIRSLYIEDSPEAFSPSPRDSRKAANVLHCYWFGDGSEEKWKDVERLRNMFVSDKRLKRWKLSTISNHSDADIQWSPGFLLDLIKADAVAIPAFQENDGLQVKSANRLLQAMALSLPVVCSPVPSYCDVIKQNEDGIICQTADDWVNAFVRLESEEYRTAIGLNAFRTAKQYSLENNIQSWINAFQLDGHFRKTQSSEEAREDKKVSDHFLRKLLERNIFYWNSIPFSFANGLAYLKARARNLVNKL